MNLSLKSIIPNKYFDEVTGYSPSGRYLQLNNDLIDLTTNNFACNLHKPDEYDEWQETDLIPKFYLSPDETQVLHVEDDEIFSLRSFPALDVITNLHVDDTMGIDFVNLPTKNSFLISRYGNLQLFSWADPSQNNKISTDNSYILGISIHPSGDLVALSCFGKIHFLTSDLEPLSTLEVEWPEITEDESESPRTVFWNKEGTLGACATTVGIIIIEYSSLTQVAAYNFLGGREGVDINLAWLPDGQHLLAGIGDWKHKLYVFDTSNGTWECPFWDSLEDYFTKFFRQDLVSAYGKGALPHRWKELAEETTEAKYIKRCFFRQDFREFVIDQGFCFFVFDVENHTEPEITVTLPE